MRRSFLQRCSYSTTKIKDRVADLLAQRALAPKSTADRQLTICGLDHARVTSEISHRTKYVVVECITPLATVPDLFAASMAANQVARSHAEALRDSNADLTNSRCQSDDSEIPSASSCWVRTSAMLHEEKFATIEFKVHVGSATGPVALWGASVFRLWLPNPNSENGEP